jgi:replicative DNA helicase
MAQIMTEQLIIGALMQTPQLLLQSDKYQFTPEDFRNPVYRYVYWAISNLAPGATKKLEIYEIENFLNSSTNAKGVYDSKNGRQALIDCNEIELGSFDQAYVQFKKENLLFDLQRFGYDTEKLYVSNAITAEQRQLNDRYAEATPADLLGVVNKEFVQLQSKYTLNDTSETQTLFDGVEEMLAELQETPEVGLPLQGILFNHIVSGAIPSRFYLRSGSSGLGKTRTMMADACHLAYPMRFSWETHRWERVGYCEKVMIIITEQSFDEVRKMALAYLTGINESIIKKGLCNEEQQKVLSEAVAVMRHFEENFYVVRVPSPSISLIKQLVREQVTLREINFVFYDYIFISPSLLGEFRGVNLRNDEILLMFSDALKQLAVELDIFIMSSTQVNANADNSNDIRNEASIAGSRAVINKADVGCIMARPTKDELKTLEAVTEKLGIEPNVVTDIYKLRGGENTQTRVWSRMDLGTLRKEDLFVTDSRLELVDIGYEKLEIVDEGELMEKTAELIAKFNGGRR